MWDFQWFEYCDFSLPTYAEYLLQLNLKNDILRRRFDSLKYDIKKIEEGAFPEWFLILDALCLMDQ